MFPEACLFRDKVYYCQLYSNLPIPPSSTPIQHPQPLNRNTTSLPPRSLRRAQPHLLLLRHHPLQFGLPPCILHMLNPFLSGLGLQFAKRIEALALRVLERILDPTSPIGEGSRAWTIVEHVVSFVERWVSEWVGCGLRHWDTRVGGGDCFRAGIGARSEERVAAV